MESIKVFSPGSITNLSCGYDILGVCLESRGDEIRVSKTNKKGLTIKSIRGFDLTKDINKNVSGIAAQALLSNISIDYGFEIEINKGINTVESNYVFNLETSTQISSFIGNELLAK